MATQLTTRITDGLGATVKNAPLTNGELDNNFLSLNSNKLEVSNNLSDIASKSAARANLEVPSRSGGNAFGTWSISITGSAAESLKLKDSFNLTIGSETLAVDGSGNVSFTLANIGAVSDSLIIEAGSGLTGGGTLTQSRTVNLGTPGTITGATTNSTTANSHTHEISLSAADVGAAPVTRQIISGDGLSGGGTLAANRTLSVDSTVVRTTGSQTISGVKTFSSETRVNSLSVNNDTVIDTSGVWLGEVALLPRGIITMWSGSIASIPNGWALCDGSNGTPNLRNRFVVGAGSTYNPGDTGGSNTKTTNTAGAHNHSISVSVSPHTLNISRMPSHRHGVAPSREKTFGRFPGRSDRFRGDRSRTDNASTSFTGGGNSHSHGASGSSSSAGNHNHRLDVRPPYFALAYIMKL